MSYPFVLPEEESPEVEILSEAECWDLLAAAPIGRLGVLADGGVDIFPVNFTVRDRSIYFRSAPGSKLVDIAQTSSVAFEIDGSRLQKHWSVVVKGDAERMSLDTEIMASGVLELSTLTSSAKWNYLRIHPRLVTGRRFVSRPNHR